MTTIRIGTFSNPQLRSHLIVLACMAIAAGLSVILRPTNRIADGRQAITLEAMIPQKFGDWTNDPLAGAVVVANPQQQAVLDRIYAQTLNRTYVNRQGQRIMLSIAYGSDQRDGMEVHRPEVCYPSQGFAIQAQRRGALEVSGATIPVTRLVATHGTRREPITYWITVGDRAVNDRIGQKLSLIFYGIMGRIPDGMLVRVSSIGQEDSDEFYAHQTFISDLLSSISPIVRASLRGSEARIQSRVISN